jgi:hypothetical protein
MACLIFDRNNFIASHFGAKQRFSPFLPLFFFADKPDLARQTYYADRL